MSIKRINVTQPFLPPLDEFIPYLQKIWDSKHLTNNGPYHQEFEKTLADFLGVPYISLFTNGTLALVTALQTMRITGEVITTPYSFVATTNALWWNNIKPVFVDVEPDFGNLDPVKVEAAITPQTTAILPVHVYGNPCKVEALQAIADRHGLKLLYDAAHAFGVKHKETSVLNYGDLSILSFHATKVFNTLEGGAIICHDKETKQRIDHLKNFGFAGETTVVAPGINSKMNEVQAALGLLQLNYYQNNVKTRKHIADTYRDAIDKIDGIACLPEPANTVSNFAYFPIFVNAQEYGMTRDQLYEKLKANQIFARRYFYPLITEFPMYKTNKNALNVATQMADQVICLPIYTDLAMSDLDKIIRIIVNNKNDQ